MAVSSDLNTIFYDFPFNVPNYFALVNKNHFVFLTFSCRDILVKQTARLVHPLQWPHLPTYNHKGQRSEKINVQCSYHLFSQILFAYVANSYFLTVRFSYTDEAIDLHSLKEAPVSGAVLYTQLRQVILPSVVYTSFS